MYDQTEMYEQTEAFPKTRREFAEEFLSHFQADVEAAEKSLVNAQVKLAAARRIRDDGEENLRLAIRAEEGIAGEPVVEGDAAVDAEDADFEPIAAIEGDVLDPITGEVVSKPHTGEEISQTPHVFVVWPDTDDPLLTDIGEHTTYGELVADYCSVALTDGRIEDFVVEDDEGESLDLDAAISPIHYGAEFRILEREKAELSGAKEPAA